MALELEGTLRQKLSAQSGTSARGTWTKQEFILEYPDGNFTAQACLIAFGQEKVAELAKYQIGDRVKVSFNIRSREFNGRWYNDLQIWRIAPAGATATAAGTSAPAPASSAAPASTPFNPATPPFSPSEPASAPFGPSAPAPGLDDMPADLPQDDLPF